MLLIGSDAARHIPGILHIEYLHVRPNCLVLLVCIWIDRSK